MMKKLILKNAAMLSVVALTVAISACSSNDDDDGATETGGTTADETTNGTATDMGGDTGETAGNTDGTTDGTTDGETDGTSDGGSDDNPDLTTVELNLDSTITVPPANVDGATGEGSFTVNTSTGVVTGSVTVSGTTGVPTMAHIHEGAAGETGDVLINLVGSDNGTVWTAPAEATLDTAGIAAFEAGKLYVNVHTAANAPGELRAQLVDSSAPAPGSLTISFTNTSETQPMTPPVVALHNAPDAAENGIRLFAVGQPASAEIIAIAENGNNDPLVALATAQVDAGTVTAAGVATPEMGEALPPGATSSIELALANEDQVLSVVSMVVCTNDGFSGIDSRPLSADATETFRAPVYDAGSESNVTMLNYWVPPCGGEGNLTDDENGSIAPHPGQSDSEDPQFNFAPGVELLEITVTRN